ncbi:hypothetical protein R3W88_004155 [Solanum pinnatisectum]|uniref:Uncharacterized protein n=1 Tax=Solanum pinnatisectum TaxID=50273 RepID=A0AAV9K8N2_9SOLN|nr:hypothetical protein R3W88_004155 [Solanum pinnatisectum]
MGCVLAHFPVYCTVYQWYTVHFDISKLYFIFCHIYATLNLYISVYCCICSMYTAHFGCFGDLCSNFQPVCLLPRTCSSASSLALGKDSRYNTIGLPWPNWNANEEVLESKWDSIRSHALQQTMMHQY